MNEQAINVTVSNGKTEMVINLPMYDLDVLLKDFTQDSTLPCTILLVEAEGLDIEPDETSFDQLEELANMHDDEYEIVQIIRNAGETLETAISLSEGYDNMVYHNVKTMGDVAYTQAVFQGDLEDIPEAIKRNIDWEAIGREKEGNEHWYLDTVTNKAVEIY